MAIPKFNFRKPKQTSRQSLASNQPETSNMAAVKQESEGDLAKVPSAKEHVYPPTRTVNLVMGGILLSIFLVALDRLIIGVAIPSITNHFNSLNDVGWYGSAFLLPMAAFMPLLGRVYTFYNPKWVFLACITTFEIGSIICGAAPTSVALIIGRAIAGLGGSGITSGAITIVVYILPLHKRPAYMGLFGAVFGVSSVLGPLLGGVFVDKVSWRWCFYINVPFGAVTIALIWFFLKLDFEPPQKRTAREKIARLDPIGTAVFVPSIVCVLLALQNAGTSWGWSEWRTVLCFVLFSVGMVAFIGIQFWQKENATIPVRFWTYRSLVAGAFYSFFNGASMMALVYYLPIWFQAIKGASAVKAGIDLLPMVIGLVITSIAAGFLTKKTGYYTPWMYFSAIIVPIAAGLICTFEVDTGHAKWIGYQALYGLGLGMGMQQANVAAQTVLPRKDVPVGASIIFFSQTLGGSIFLSVAQNLFINKLAEGLVAADIPGISASLVTTIGATDLRNVVPVDKLPQVLVQYNIALRTTFYVGAATSAVIWIGAALMEWRSVKEQQPAVKQVAPEVKDQPTDEEKQ